MSYMTRNSHNASIDPDFVTHKVSGYITDADAWATGVKWHHGAGHSKGRGVFLFYAKTVSDCERVVALMATAAERAALRKMRAFKSKAAAWRHVAATLAERTEDKGFGSLPVKDGKFGLFVPKFGEPDFLYFFATAEEANNLTEVLHD